MLNLNNSWARVCERFLTRKAGVDRRRVEMGDSGESIGLEPMEQRLLLSATVGMEPEVRPLPPDPAFELPGDLEPDPDEPKFPLTSLPKLNSSPNAKHTIYLDFDGNFLPEWFDGTEEIESPAFDLDGDPETFTQHELDVIEEVFYRVAEDFAPFQVNVTTVHPGSFGSGRAARIVIGGNNEWFQDEPEAAGVAPIGGFFGQGGRSATGFAFSDVIGDNPVFTAGVISHEAGHLFNLNHQSLYDEEGELVEEYHPGQESEGLVNESPLMGNGAPTDIWWFGPTPDSDPEDEETWQNDLKILFDALGQRPDDFGNTRQNAYSLGLLNGPRSMGGLIGNNNDVDAFKFSTSGGEFTFDLDGAFIGQNLDAALVLTDELGNQIEVADPDSTLDASMTVDLEPGVYYLAVRSTGEYGFIGQWRLDIFAPESGNGQIFGHVFRDVNNKKTEDAGEPGMAGLLVYVDLNGNGQHDRGFEQATRTNAAGNYILPFAPSGTYDIRVDAGNGWLATGLVAGVGASQSVTVFNDIPVGSFDFAIRPSTIRRSYVDAGGRRVTVILIGHGDFEILRDSVIGNRGNASEINVWGTTRNSLMRILVAGKKTRTLIDGDINVTGAMAGILGRNKASINGDINSTNVVRNIQFDNVFAKDGQNEWNIGPSAFAGDRVVIVVGNLFDTTINSATGFGTVNIRNARDMMGPVDSINGPTMDYLMIGQRRRRGPTNFFESEINLSGMDSEGRSLVRANLYTTLSHDWDFAGGVGSVMSRAVGSGFVGNIEGTVTRWMGAGNFMGTLNANRLDYMRLQGSLINASLNLTREVEFGILSLDMLYVTGGIVGTTVNSAGHINYIGAAEVRNSWFGAGVDGAPAGTVNSLAGFDGDARINNFIVRVRRVKKAGPAFTNSFINARHLGKVDLGSVPNPLNFADSGIAMDTFEQIVYRQSNRTFVLNHPADLFSVPNAGNLVVDVN